MRSSVLLPLAVALLVGCRSNDEPIIAFSDPLPGEQREEAEKLAAQGDAEAAWQLYIDSAICPPCAEQWLDRAAELKHPSALRVKAAQLRYGGWSEPANTTAEGREQFRALLDEACRSDDGRACVELARAFADGFLGPAGAASARTYWQRAADLGNRDAWVSLANQLYHGIGGQADRPAAYYWISLEARCVDPRSVSGVRTWALREQIAALLSREQLESGWARIDAYIAEVRSGARRVDMAPFGVGVPEQARVEGMRLADEREAAHRQEQRVRFQ
jgi:hypothetical protein